MFFDSHCHLDLLTQHLSAEVALDQAFDQGVQELFVPGVAAKRWRETVSVSRAEHRVRRYYGLGLHPCFLSEHQDQADLENLEKQLRDDPNIRAIGECGLDFFIENPDRSRQIALFDAQVRLACRYQKPLVIHARRSVDQVLKCLRSTRPAQGGVVHAFSGSYQQASQLWDLGFNIGIGGTVTYERAQRLRKVLQQMPIESILLETDAPDMPLSGYQGRPNRPSQLPKIAKVVAELRQTSLDSIAKTSTQAAQSLFATKS